MKPRAYWLHTSGNEIIGEWIASASPALQDKLRLLLDGKPIETALHDTLAYQKIHRSEDMRLIVLCMTGYLRIESEEPRTRY